MFYSKHFLKSFFHYIKQSLHSFNHITRTNKSRDNNITEIEIKYIGALILYFTRPSLISSE